MPTLQTRLGPSLGDLSRHTRKYSLAFIHEACDLVDRIGFANAQRALGTPKMTLSNWSVARRRARMTLEEACADLMRQHGKSPYRLNRQGVDCGIGFVEARQNRLRFNTEVAREGYQTAKRLGRSFPACIRAAAIRRHANPRTVTYAVRAGLIPEHWLSR